MRASTSRASRSAAVLVAAALLTAAGCSFGPKYEFAEVEGKVTLDGQLLSGVKVAFYPDSDDRVQQPYATGMTDGSGIYKLTTSTGARGALVGKNRVVVNWPLPERPGPGQPPPPPPGPPIPLRFTVVVDTPVIVEVKPGAKQTIDVPLSSF